MGGIHLFPVIKLWLKQRQTCNPIGIMLKGNRTSKTLILRDAENADISDTLEFSLVES